MYRLILKTGLAGLLLLPLNVAGTTIRIMPLGDSVTHGWYAGHGTNVLNSYRKTLKSLLDADGYSTDFVGSLTDGNFSDPEHEGHDGCFADHPSSSNKLLGRIGTWLAATPADVILLHIGTNDINAGDTNTAAEVSTVLDEIYTANPNAAVVLALIINVKNDPPLFTAVSTYNSNLNLMAQARIAAGDNLQVVDMEYGAGIDYTSGDMNDRLHPSPAGYDKMATNWYPYAARAIRQQAWLQNGPPNISSVSVATNSLNLGITNLIPGLPITVESTSSFSPAAWSPISTLSPAGTATNWTGSAGATHAFFRVIGE